MIEEWKPVKEFPGYSVSNTGKVRNDDNDRIMAILVNQQGVGNVGLTKNYIQYKRSLGLLVAEAFLQTAPQGESFDTPIHLDGDKTNSHISNLMWRPRWFAVKYHQQFNQPPKGFRVPIMEIETRSIFETSWEAAITYGLLDEEILSATINRTYVWPTYQKFEVLEEA